MATRKWNRKHQSHKTTMDGAAELVGADVRRHELIRHELKKYENTKAGLSMFNIPFSKIQGTIRKAGVWPTLTTDQVADAATMVTQHIVDQEIIKIYFDLPG